MIYTTWDIWNERNSRIFQGVSQSPTQILGLIKEEMEVRWQSTSMRGPVGHVTFLMYLSSKSSSFLVSYVITPTVVTALLLLIWSGRAPTFYFKKKSIMEWQWGTICESFPRNVLSILPYQSIATITYLQKFTFFPAWLHSFFLTYLPFWEPPT